MALSETIKNLNSNVLKCVRIFHLTLDPYLTKNRLLAFSTYCIWKCSSIGGIHYAN